MKKNSNSLVKDIQLLRKSFFKRDFESQTKKTVRNKLKLLYRKKLIGLKLCETYERLLDNVESDQDLKILELIQADESTLYIFKEELSTIAEKLQ